MIDSNPENCHMIRRALFFLTAILIVACLGTAVAAVDGNADEGKKIAIKTCAACHGADGNSKVPMYPNLAAQVPDYIAKQLHEFKSGARDNQVMKGMVKDLSDADIANLAVYYAQQKLNAGKVKNASLAKQGEAIYRQGLKEKGLPACADCHGEKGKGMAPLFPLLHSQHSQYVETQLTNFKKGARSNDPLQMMRNAAGLLSEGQIKALAEYVQGLGG
ncbi:MAG: c-type cytochrome [Pseudomonadota bacterium]